MKTRTTYHRGIMACQYRTADAKSLTNGSFFTSQASIRLEPRFRFLETEEITEKEYPGDEVILNSPFIVEKGEHEVEFHFKGATDPVKGSRRMRVNEILLMPVTEGSPPSGLGGLPGSRPLEDLLKPHLGLSGLQEPFTTRIEKDTCGRIVAPAFVKSIEYLGEDDKPIPLEDVPKVRLESNTVTVTGTTVNTVGQGAVVLKDRGGCLGIPRSLAAGGPAGIRRAMAGGGCMLPLLLLGLAGLLWGMGGMRGCGKAEGPPPVIVHDTVYVEVEKTDTLMIVKKDTVSYIDSTSSVSYQSVSLPNVQFITNSDVLLPTSASDLQQLAEYLIKNDSLTATIYGHTDSVGNPKSNMTLSQKRAQSVRRFLASLGVDGSRLEAVGMGDTQPRADNRLEEGRLMNRRVEVKLTKTVFSETKRTRLDPDSARQQRGELRNKTNPE